jgi:hypothetical protein
MDAWDFVFVFWNLMGFDACVGRISGTELLSASGDNAWHVRLWLYDGEQIDLWLERKNARRGKRRRKEVNLLIEERDVPYLTYYLLLYVIPFVCASFLGDATEYQ